MWMKKINLLSIGFLISGSHTAKSSISCVNILLLTVARRIASRGFGWMSMSKMRRIRSIMNSMDFAIEKAMEVLAIPAEKWEPYKSAVYL